MHYVTSGTLNNNSVNVLRQINTDTIQKAEVDAWQKKIQCGNLKG